MEDRAKLLFDYNSFVKELGGYFTDEARVSRNVLVKRKYIFLAYSFLSIPSMVNLVLQGVAKKDNLLLLSGLRMIEENNANVSYVFRYTSKTDYYISRILDFGMDYKRAFTELRSKPELGMKHLRATGRWTTSTITQRVGLLGEGAEFRYEVACRYLHTDVWAMLNDNDVSDHEGFMYGQMSWAIEDIRCLIDIVHNNDLLVSEYDARRTELLIRTEKDSMNEPSQTYSV